MTFLAPGFFFASLAVAAVIVVLHLIVTRQPRAGILPTARFVPDLPATATARATRPSDRLLMLLRILLVLAVGAGLSRPVFKPSRATVGRVVLADVSRSADDSASLRDSLRAVYRSGDALILFDSAARVIGGDAADSIQSITPGSGKSRISAGLIAALRAGSAMRDAADSIELVIVSSFASDMVDAASPQIRSLWPGGARLVRVANVDRSAEGVRSQALSITPAPNDPLAVTVALAQGRNGGTIVRSGSVARVGDTVARATIEWEAAGRPRGAVPRARVDTIGGVVADTALVVAGFARRWSYPADSVRDGVIVARWIDGEPAAVEWKSGDGCRRSVSVPVTPIGDLAIRGDFVAFVRAIAGPCLNDLPFVSIGEAGLAMLRGSGGLAPRDAFSPRSDTRSWLAPWLLVLALVCATGELVVRRRKVRDIAYEARSGAMKSAA